MFFVVDKPKLQRMLAIIRDDRTRGAQARGGHYLRLEASGEKLIVAGPAAEATIGATVYEEGVLFLKITRFRRILALLVRQKMLSIQVNGEGLFVGGVRLSLAANDMLLYVDPAKAPEVCPL